MGILEIILIGIVLSIDAFAAAMCRGLSMRKINYLHAVITAFIFGAFQAVMPLIGWALGTQFKSLIENVDHWVAFGLLILIGGKMIFDVVFAKKDEEEKPQESEKLNFKELLLMAVATSIDALAMGITFAMVDGLGIGWSATIIGVLTFAICFVGVLIGHKFGNKFEKHASLIGGIVLILIGLKILLEHLGIIHLGF